MSNNDLMIEVNLSIDKCGGAEKMALIIEELKKSLGEKFPDAQIVVRKGYFQTIDGIWSNDEAIERDVKFFVEEVRNRIVAP